MWAALSDNSDEFRGYIGHRKALTDNLHNWASKWDVDPTILISKVPSEMEKTKWADLMIENWHNWLESLSEPQGSKTWTL